LARTERRELDGAYVERMVRDEKGSIALFETPAKSGDAQDFRQFASKTLPTLQ